MIYIPRTTCPFGRYSNEAFIFEARKVQISLTQSAYNMVQPTPAEVTPLIDQMEMYLLDNSERNYKSVPLRIELRKQITSMLRLQSASVNGLANGNIDFMLNSSFPLNKVPQPHQAPEQGQMRNVLALSGGAALVSFYGIRTRDFYEVQVTGTNGYSSVFAGVSPKMRIPNLPTGVSLEVKVRGCNGKGVGEWSVPMTITLAPSNNQAA